MSAAILPVPNDSSAEMTSAVVNPTVRDDGVDSSRVRHVGERIGVEQDQVGPLAEFDRAHLSVQAHERRGNGRCAAQRLHGCHSVSFDEKRELVMEAEPEEGAGRRNISSGHHLHTRLARL